ncbi:hypothetical protein FA10DRAFT_292008, partial [Acaromyces ingoldii]
MGSKLSPWRAVDTASHERQVFERTIFGFESVLASFNEHAFGPAEPSVGLQIGVNTSMQARDRRERFLMFGWMSSHDDKDSIRLQFTPLSDRARKDWLEQTLEVEREDLSIEDLRIQQSTVLPLGRVNEPDSYMIKLIVSMSSRADLLSILIRSHHVLFDGPGLLSVLDRFLERLALDGHGALDNDHVAPSVDMQSPLRRLRSHALDAVGMTEDDYNSGEPYGDLGKRLIEVGCLMPNG